MDFNSLKALLTKDNLLLNGDLQSGFPNIKGTTIKYINTCCNINHVHNIKVMVMGIYILHISRTVSQQFNANFFAR